MIVSRPSLAILERVSTLSPILQDHFRAPRNVGRPRGPHRAARAENVACGDVVDLFAGVVDDRVGATGFLAQGCSAVIGAASFLTEWAKGRAVSDVLAIEVDRLLAEVGETNPARRHGVSMALRALQEALREALKEAAEASPHDAGTNQ